LIFPISKWHIFPYFFFHKNKLWDICEKGHSHDVVLAVTKRVNGGVHGLEERQKNFDFFHNTLA